MSRRRPGAELSLTRALEELLEVTSKVLMQTGRRLPNVVSAAANAPLKGKLKVSPKALQNTSDHLLKYLQQIRATTYTILYEKLSELLRTNQDICSFVQSRSLVRKIDS